MPKRKPKKEGVLRMERIIHDVKVYAATVVETIHDAALLILHNIKDIVRE